MNILICGKNTPYLKNLAERLKKEKNEIHYISGSKASEKVGKPVFQQFDFEYTNVNIGRIVKSTKADTMVILGATDRNFSWRDPADDAMSFVSGMSSLLMAAKGAGVRRVIYVSSLSVFEDCTDPITFETEPAVSSFMGDAFLQVEKLCKNLSDEKTEILILRLPPETGYYDINSLNDFCLQVAGLYLSGEAIPYFPEQQHAVMFYTDASDAIVKLINFDNSEGKQVFQLQGVVFTEQEYIDALVKTEKSKNCKPEPEKENGPKTRGSVLLKGSDEERLHFGARYGIEEIAENVCNASLTHEKKTEKKSGVRLHVLPVIETIVGAVIAALITFFLRQTWVGDSFSFFTIYSLLFGAVYGTTYGLFAGVLATIGALIIQWHDVGLIQTIENYSFFLCFLQFILVGIIAGYIHDKYVRRTTTLREERNYLSQEVNDLTRINDNNIYVKNVYEKRLIGYENSLPRLYELTSQLDYMEPENVIFHATLVTLELLEVEDVAIYMSSQRSNYYRLNAANSERAASCGKSFKYDEESFLYSAFEQREIYRNNRMDLSKPSFAGAVMDGDRINAIIMVWTNDLHKINQYECDMLAIVCRLIEKSMTRANIYNQAVREESYIEGTRIMKSNTFIKTFENYAEGRSKGVFSFTLLKLEANAASAVKAQQMIRDTDILGVYQDTLYIILPFSSAADAEHVTERFQKAGVGVCTIDLEVQEALLKEMDPVFYRDEAEE